MTYPILSVINNVPRPSVASQSLYLKQSSMWNHFRLVLFFSFEQNLILLLLLVMVVICSNWTAARSSPVSLSQRWWFKILFIFEKFLRWSSPGHRAGLFDCHRCIILLNKSRFPPLNTKSPSPPFQYLVGQAWTSKDSKRVVSGRMRWSSDDQSLKSWSSEAFSKHHDAARWRCAAVHSGCCSWLMITLLVC